MKNQLMQVKPFPDSELETNPGQGSVWFGFFLCNLQMLATSAEPFKSNTKGLLQALAYSYTNTFASLQLKRDQMC